MVIIAWHIVSSACTHVTILVAFYMFTWFGQLTFNGLCRGYM